MQEWDGQHPDEGTIHAWLDGALDATESARIEEHVGDCAECTGRVAEARGLVAGASRIVGLLDAAPAPLLRAATTPTAGDSGTMWRLFRVTPARASIAAMLLVALGITMTRNRVAQESVSPSMRTRVSAADEVAASPAAANHALPRDAVLDSAIARRLANEQPIRTLRPTPGASVPAPMPSELATATAPDPSSVGRVTAARKSLSAQRDSSGAPADRARVGFSGAGSATPMRMDVAARDAEAAGARNMMAKASGSAIRTSPAGECYRIETSGPSAATWGTAALPFVLAFDSSGTSARVLTPAGGVTDTRATLMRAGEDSVVLRLQRIGFSGSLALAGKGDTREGKMQSAQLQVMLDAVVATGVTSGVGAEARMKRADAPRAAQVPAAPAREAPTVARPASNGASITARLVACPR